MEKREDRPYQPRRILVPLDGSELSERALPYAKMLAASLGSQIVLLCAIPHGEHRDGTITEGTAEDQEATDRYLEARVVELARAGVAAEARAPVGDPAEWIIEEASSGGVGLMAMATHGRSGLGRWVYGSVAEAVLAHAPVPVMLVRAWSHGVETPVLGRGASVLVPLDGSRRSEQALPVAQGLADALEGELVLMRAYMPVVVPAAGRVGYALTPVPSGDVQTAAVRAEAQSYLESVAPSGSKMRCEARMGLASDAILEAAREHEAALVVMATHGRTGVARAVLGSVADAVLRGGDRPLVLVRAG